MRNWQNEFISDVVYEVEQENKTGGGVTLDYFKTKEEAEAKAKFFLNCLTKYERKLYVINVNTYRWNAEDEEYEYVEGQTV